MIVSTQTVDTSKGDRSERFRFFTADELKELPPPRWLIEGAITEQSLVLLYGDSNDGKSFIAIDMALSVAAGVWWQERQTKGGPVVYVVGEGQRGIPNRVGAWKKERGIDSVPDGHFTLEAVQLHEGKDVELLLEKMAERELKPSLVFIDTLATCFEGGDENDGVDMGLLLKGCRRLMAETGATVVLIHHQGKNPKRGARGHTSLFAATDIVFQVKKDGKVVGLIPRKFREDDRDAGFEFRFKSVELGRDEDGRTVSSAVLVPREEKDGDDKRGHLSAVEQVLLGTLRSLGGNAKTGVWQKLAEEEAEVTEDKFFKARTKLVEKGLLDDTKRGFPRLTEAGVTAAANFLPQAAEGSRPH